MFDFLGSRRSITVGIRHKIQFVWGKGYLEIKIALSLMAFFGHEEFDLSVI